MTSGVEVRVTGIFPVPIYQTILSREISTEEKIFSINWKEQKIIIILTQKIIMF